MKSLLDPRPFAIFDMVLVSLAASAQTIHHRTPKQKNKYRVVTYDVASGTYTGETLRGPVTVIAKNLNTIRYQYQFNSTATFTAAPDIWTNLGTLASQNATSGAPPLPTAPVPNAVTTPGSTPQVANNNAAPHNPAPAPADPFAPIQSLLDQANKVLVPASQALDKGLRDQQLIFTQPIEDLRVDTIQLQTDQAPITEVAQAGSALTIYLASIRDETAELVTATKAMLANNSIFTQGINATWPASTEVIALQNKLAANTKALSVASTQFSTYSPVALQAFQASDKSLTGLLAQLNAAYATFTAANTPTPAQIAAVSATLSNLQGQIGGNQADEQFLNQMTGSLSTAVAQNAAAVTSAAALTLTSSTYTAFANAQTALGTWQNRMAATMTQWAAFTANPPTASNPFSMSRDGDCEFAFSTTKNDAITLTRVDLTPGLTNQTALPVLSVTAQCTSPISLSAGVVFSTIPDSEFGIAATPATAGTAAPTDVVTQTYGSNFHPLPLALANVRFYEPNDHVAFYWSFGVAANIRDQTSGGSAAEYLLGPSIGLFRTFIITAGAHFGSRASVGGGYAVNSTIPSTVTTVPINTNYTAGFGLGITFTKP